MPYVYVILDGTPDDLSDSATGVFYTEDEAIAHGNEHIAEWSPWVVGKVEIVYVHTPEEDRI